MEHGSSGAAAKSPSLPLAPASQRTQSPQDAMGQLLRVRGRQMRSTPADQSLRGYVRQMSLLEADLLNGLQGGHAGQAVHMQSLRVAVNSDSLSSCFLPGVAVPLQQHQLLQD